MVDQAVTQTDLANLARKLDEVASILTKKEMAVLLAVFKLAGEAVTTRIQRISAAGEQESGSQTTAALRAGALSSGFSNAFQPLGAADFDLRSGTNDIANGVGISILF